MKAKLTLTVNRKSIEDARSFARKKNKSISRLVESYFNSLQEKQSLLEHWAGILDIKEVEKKAAKDERLRSLLDKHVYRKKTKRR